MPGTSCLAPSPSSDICAPPTDTFAALTLHPSLERALGGLGFSRPTPIQRQAIPPALAGRDLLATAMTGSGKTAAFLLPILHGLVHRPRGTTRARVLTPTRELAAQVLADLRALAAHTSVAGAAVFGGVGIGPQAQAFRRGVDVVIGTPGRLLDHLQSRQVKLAGLEYLVFDEADRMLDMGFLPDIRRILERLPARRQTLFFSATMPPPIATLARGILREPVSIDVGTPVTPAVGVAQAVYPVAQHLKAELLVTLLTKGDIRDALVFTRTKHRADRLARQLAGHNIRVARIHGNRSQAQRTEALAGFKNRKYRVLVATDIAARGIDITALGHVVNFDTPAAAEDYVHRVGRTARAEATGTAFTFASPEEESNLRTIERAIRQRLPRVTVPDFDYRGRSAEALEVPRHERIAAIRRQKAASHARGAALVVNRRRRP
jgi:ATP-dependent RNA helicase RhlE